MADETPHARAHQSHEALPRLAQGPHVHIAHIRTVTQNASQSFRSGTYSSLPRLTGGSTIPHVHISSESPRRRYAYSLLKGRLHAARSLLTRHSMFSLHFQSISYTFPMPFLYISFAFLMHFLYISLNSYTFPTTYWVFL